MTFTGQLDTAILARMKRGHTTSGFTLIEVLVVIVIIALLASISVFVFRGIVSRANDSMVQQDLARSMKELLFYSATYSEVIPTANELALSEYKISISKKSSYKMLIYCNASDYWGGPSTEAVLVAHTANDKLFMYTTETKKVTDVTSQIGPSTYSGPNTSSVGQVITCWDFIKPGRTGTGQRFLIHEGGGVEGGYVKIINN